MSELYEYREYPDDYTTVLDLEEKFSYKNLMKHTKEHEDGLED